MEEWKDAPGFEGFYQVSNEGHFRSVDRTVIMKTKNGKDKPTHFKSRLLKKYIENAKRSNIKRIRRAWRITKKLSTSRNIIYRRMDM